MGDSNPHFNFSPHLGDTLTCSPVFAGGATRTHIIPLPTQPKTPATDGRTRLERVEWHIGGLSATEAHHLCFVPLLYHNLGDLSRGFLKFLGYPRPLSRGSIIGKLASPPRLGFCILRIPNIFSACGVWFTFVFRKQEHLAVGSSVTRSYSLSWAPTFSWSPCPRLLYPYCITL